MRFTLIWGVRMSSQSGAMLLVESGLSIVTPIFLETPTFAIGKASSANFSIDNPFVSRVHCQIRFADGAFFLSRKKAKMANTMAMSHAVLKTPRTGSSATLSKAMRMAR